MERVFLDANVLFSASYDPSCRIARLWRLDEVELVASRLIAAEAIRNIEDKHPGGLEILRRLLRRCAFVDESQIDAIVVPVELSAKDRPVLAAAIAGRVDYLLTGDKHFRPYFG
jgi:uncharacterized protein